MSVILLAEQGLNVFEITVGLLGGLALFIYGMQRLSDSLKAAAGEGMKHLLAKLTTNRFTAAITGALVTAVIQSSSVTTVLVVGFVSAGLMSLQQSIGVIMGANVGTTLTAQIVAFDVTNYAWLMVAVGVGLASFSRNDKLRLYGMMTFGLGMLFIGMDQMSEATLPLRSYEPFIRLMGRMDNPLLGILAGAIFTALVQSSSATTGIVIMLASQGFLTLEAGIALTIGSNIGTCFTAGLSAIGKPPEAVRAAAVHVLFNVIGALLWVGLIGQLAELARAISPASPDLTGIQRLAAETPRQVANANSIFNVANTCLLIWFVGPIAKLAIRLIPDKPSPQPKTTPAAAKYLEPVYLKTPSLALDRVRMELERLGAYVTYMLETAQSAVVHGTKGEIKLLRAMDDDVDHLYLAIVSYLSQLGREQLTTRESQTLDRLLAAASHLESIGDSIGTNLAAQGKRRLKRKLTFSDQTIAAMHPLHESVLQCIRDSVDAVKTSDYDLAKSVIDRRDQIRQQADSLLEHLARRLMTNEPDRAAVYSVESDIINQLERLSHIARSIAQLVINEQAGHTG